MKPDQQQGTPGQDDKKINVPQPKPEVGLGAGKRESNIDDRSASDKNPERLPGRDESLEEHDDVGASDAEPTVTH